MKSFLGVTGHYISNEWKLESVMLSCNRISRRHTGENILQSYEEVASEFNIYMKARVHNGRGRVSNEGIMLDTSVRMFT